MREQTLVKVPLLDHGYIALVETWGSDESIIEAARMSTDKGFLGWDGAPCPLCPGQIEGGPVPEGRAKCKGCNGKGVVNDEKLLAFLYKNRHDTPFEMAGAIIEVQAPIFVFREWHRHRTQSYNELSGRYAEIPDFNYIPSLERLMMGSDGKNKQAGTIAGAAVLTEEVAQRFREYLKEVYADGEELYQQALKAGVPKELARVHIPVGRYSRMRASANLRNWLAFMTLRSDKNPGAQWEIRQYANEVGRLLLDRFPRTFDLFNNGQRNG